MVALLSEKKIKKKRKERQRLIKSCLMFTPCRNYMNQRGSDDMEKNSDRTAQNYTEHSAAVVT